MAQKSNSENLIFLFLGHFSDVFFIRKLRNDVFVHNEGMKVLQEVETKRQRLGNCIKKQTRDNFIAQFPLSPPGPRFLMWVVLHCILYTT